MAYNLESLVKILEQILHPAAGQRRRWILDDHGKQLQIESLLKKAKQILEISWPPSGQERENLEAEIRDAAHEAEDMMESHMVDQMLLKPRDESFSFTAPDLQQLIDKLDSAKAKLTKITKGKLKPDSSSPDHQGVPLKPNPQLVGLEDDILKLKHRLTGESLHLDVIPISGMGGIGKTTLAANLYNDRLIVERFEICAWVTISQEYDVRAILLRLVDFMPAKLPPKQLQKESQLGEFVHKELHRRRYLVVLDDIWSPKAWEDIRHCFPDNENGSRIMLTTRQPDVGLDSSRRDTQHQMHLLNDSDSWKLLQQKVFGEEKCPTALERVGKTIAINCRGLPLAINVIGGHLAMAERTKESWKLVRKDVRTILTEKDKDFSKILTLSYNYLPDHLKPCFLYMGAFPTKYKVRASRLIRLWMAEGFVKSIENKSMEEAAASYLEALVSRNLLLVEEKDCHGKAKSCCIHDCLRELCVEQAKKEKFLCLRIDQKLAHDQEKPSADQYWRRVSVNPLISLLDFVKGEESKRVARSFLYIGVSSPHILRDVLFLTAFGLLRVLDIFDIEFHLFPTEILHLVNLRYLAFSCNADIPPAISRLWNLQTLIVRSKKGVIDLPTQLWEISELRHVNLKKTVIWVEYAGYRTLSQKMLQTTSTMNLYGLIESGFLQSVPNIKKLGICFDFSPDIVNLQHLDKLETLKMLGNYESVLIFPPRIRKLTLSECFLNIEFMKSIGSLPHLEVLKIQNSHFQIQGHEGEEMQPTDDSTSEEDQYCSLQFLLLENLNLVSWPTDWTDFPRLHCLVIRHCSALKEIPGEIGDISTFKIFDLDKSSPSVVESAERILTEQADQYGNDGLILYVKTSSGRETHTAQSIQQRKKQALSAQSPSLIQR